MKKILLFVLILTASLFAENLQAQAKNDKTNKQIQAKNDTTNKQVQAKTGTAKQEKSKDKSKTPETTETDTTITTIKKEELRNLKEAEKELGKLTNEKNQLKTKVDSLEKVLPKNHVELSWWKNNWLPLLIGFSCGLGLILLAFLGWKKWSEKQNEKSLKPETGNDGVSAGSQRKENGVVPTEKEEFPKLSDLERKINELKTVLQNENQKQTAELMKISTELLKQTELSKRFLNLEGKVLVVSDLAEDLKRELENLPDRKKIQLTESEKHQLRESKRKLESLNSGLKELDVYFTVNQNEWKRQRRDKIESLLKASEQLLAEPSQNTLVRLLSHLQNPEENDFGVEEILEKTTDRNLRDTLISLAFYLDKEEIFENEIFNPLIREFGAEVIYPEKNSSFNQQTMEPTTTRTVQGIDRNCVVSVERRGFRVGNEVVQKARVVLGN
ncbi:hypothetical protein IT568_12270 [bacterium]|nr:hypothetical protein [bacterium]